MKKGLLGVFMSVVAGLALFSAGTSFAVGTGCENLPVDSSEYAEMCGTGTQEDLQARIMTVLNTVYLWVGVIAVIVIIIGGIYYTISMGDPGKVKKAKDTIMYALIGLAVTLLAFAITNFVLNAVG